MIEIHRHQGAPLQTVEVLTELTLSFDRFHRFMIRPLKKREMYNFGGPESECEVFQSELQNPDCSNLRLKWSCINSEEAACSHAPGTAQ